MSLVAKITRLDVNCFQRSTVVLNSRSIKVSELFNKNFATFAFATNHHKPNLNIRKLSSINQKENMANPDIYVQLLPVILPKPSQPQGKILLCKWTSGAFQGRYTGLIKTLGQIQNDKSDSGSIDLKANLTSVAKNLLPLSLQNNLDKIDLVGILTFDGPPETDEYQFLGTLKDSNDEIISNDALKFEDHPCFWFDWDKIPFDEMPADDAIWYPKVLQDGKKVKGSFIFGGWSEKTIKSYELSSVEFL